MHKAGFVNIVGNPNVGKSTLMNALVGERLSIITSKAQTTRHRIMGIVNGEDFQMVYSDTPGVLHPNYKLQEQMLEFSRSALVDADVLLYVTDVQDNADRNAEFLEKVKKIAKSTTAGNSTSTGNTSVTKNTPKVFLIINKIDLTTQETLERLVEFWHTQLPEATIFPISAQERFGVTQLFDAIRDALPECPPFFPKDQLTDKPARFFVDEIIREKILLCYDKEIPYSVEVEVESFKEAGAPAVEQKSGGTIVPGDTPAPGTIIAEQKSNAQLEKKSSDEEKESSPRNRVSKKTPRMEDKGIIRIGAVIYCERESQKGIIIGKGGKALKKVGQMARMEIEEFFQKPVYLQLFVKVDKDWRSNQNRLKHYGYDLS